MYVEGISSPRKHPLPTTWGLTWAVCRLFGCHLHEESHLLALREGIASSDSREPHAKQQPGLPGDRLLLNPLPLRTLLLCEVVEERGEISCHRVLRTQSRNWHFKASSSHLTEGKEQSWQHSCCPSSPLPAVNVRHNSNTLSSANEVC